MIVDKAPSADLVTGQTDEGDFGISYAKADQMLNWLLHGYTPASSWRAGSTRAEVELVRRAPRAHALEAPAADRRDAQLDGDRRELPAAGGLLTPLPGEIEEDAGASRFHLDLDVRRRAAHGRRAARRRGERQGRVRAEDVRQGVAADHVRHLA